MDVSLFHCLDLYIDKNKPFSKITDYVICPMNLKVLMSLEMQGVIQIPFCVCSGIFFLHLSA